MLPNSPSAVCLWDDVTTCSCLVLGTTLKRTMQAEFIPAEQDLTKVTCLVKGGEGGDSLQNSILSNQTQSPGNFPQLPVRFAARRGHALLHTCADAVKLQPLSFIPPCSLSSFCLSLHFPSSLPFSLQCLLTDLKSAQRKEKAGRNCCRKGGQCVGAYFFGGGGLWVVGGK